MHTYATQSPKDTNWNKIRPRTLVAIFVIFALRLFRNELSSSLGTLRLYFKAWTNRSYVNTKFFSINRFTCSIASCRTINAQIHTSLYQLVLWLHRFKYTKTGTGCESRFRLFYVFLFHFRYFNSFFLLHS